MRRYTLAERSEQPPAELQPYDVMKSRYDNQQLQSGALGRVYSWGRRLASPSILDTCEFGGSLLPTFRMMLHARNVP